MTEAEPDLDYFMRRAREEAHCAQQAEKPEAAAAHRGLSIRYSAKAVMAIAEDSLSAFPQLTRPPSTS